jgi:hypothetical protein
VARLHPVATTSSLLHPDDAAARTSSGQDAGGPPGPAERPLRLVLVVVAGAFLAMYVAIAIARMRYPYELEWIEGGVVDEVRHALGGSPLYGRPSLEYIPNIYTPLYYYVAALPLKVLGGSFFAPRLVSFIASLGAFACVGALVRTETRDNVVAFVSACLFAACFRRGGGWFDLARVDSLFVALLFAGLLTARRATTSRGAAFAGVVMTLAFLTKQAALIPAALVVIFLWRRRRALGLWYAGALGVGLFASTAAFSLWSGGWYRFYVFDMPAAHEVVSEQYRAFWSHDLLAPFALALVLGALGLWWSTKARTGDGVAIAWFYVPVTAGLLASAYQGRLHSGGYDNVLFPMFGAVAVIAGLGLHAATVFSRRSNTMFSRRSIGSRRSRAIAWLAPIATVLAIVQLATLTYDPLEQVPSAADRRTGAQMIAALRSLPGTVYLPGHGEYLRRVGKKTGVYSSALEDVIRADVRGQGKALARALDRAVASGRWDWIVMDSVPTFSYLPRSLSDAYTPVGTLVPRRHPPRPLTGTMTGPLTVWARRDPPPPGGVPATLVPITAPRTP